MAPTMAPRGDLATFQRSRFEHGGFAHDLYRKGQGPAVLVLTEMPGISPQVLGFADVVVAAGLSVVLPDLFGEAGRDPLAGGRLAAVGYVASSISRACISEEFTAFALGTPSKAVGYLRALAAEEHARCGGPGVGVVGMCFTGGFALAMASDPRVLAPVLSQPSLPMPLTASRKRSIDCDAETMNVVRGRCAKEGLRVLGLRFDGDPFVPRERFAYLREQLGDGFVAVDLRQRDGNPDAPFKVHHSVLTASLVDEPGTPTREARDRVIALFREKLLPPA